MSEVRYWDLEGRRWYVGAALFSYQVALGVTMRWFGGQPHARLYVGPVKLYAGRKASESQPAMKGGTR